MVLFDISLSRGLDEPLVLSAMKDTLHIKLVLPVKLVLLLKYELP